MFNLIKTFYDKWMNPVSFVKGIRLGIKIRSRKLVFSNGPVIDGVQTLVNDELFLILGTVSLPNAMSTVVRNPDGKQVSAVVLNSALLATDDDMIKACVGHELGHINLGHIERRLRDGNRLPVRRLKEELEADAYLVGMYTPSLALHMLDTFYKLYPGSRSEFDLRIEKIQQYKHQMCSM